MKGKNVIGFKIWKKSAVVVLLAFSFCVSHGQDDAAAVADITAHREKQEATFRDPKETPLLPKDRKRFKGLDYYPIDLRYRVEARFVRSENPVFFKMKTTTSRLPDYVKYGEVHFTLEGRPFKLEVYQSPDIIQRPGYEDYLFIPFTDPTNGDETYDVGRYLEFRIPETEAVIVDFNKAYNPYCSYSPNYSCPIPPEANHLNAAIPAGEKRFGKKKH